MSKTPRTDTQLKFEAFFDGIGIVETVEVEFAQELETELADARAEIERVTTSYEHNLAVYIANKVKSEAKRDKLIEQMRHFIENLAKQKTTEEMTSDAFDDADFEGGYDYIVTDARRINAALAAERGEGL